MPACGVPGMHNRVVQGPSNHPITPLLPTPSPPSTHPMTHVPQVGYSDLYVDASKVYQLRVTTKGQLAKAAAALEASGRLGAINGGVPPLQPTWPAVAAFFEHAFANLTQPLELPQEAVDLLGSASFAQLTGCPAYCTYQVGPAFPSPNQTVSVVTQARQPGDRACPLPRAGTAPSTAEELDAASQLCEEDWREALVSGSGRVAGGTAARVIGLDWGGWIMAACVPLQPPPTPIPLSLTPPPSRPPPRAGSPASAAPTTARRARRWRALWRAPRATRAGRPCSSAPSCCSTARGASTVRLAGLGGAGSAGPRCGRCCQGCPAGPCRSRAACACCPRPLICRPVQRRRNDSQVRLGGRREHGRCDWRKACACCPASFVCRP